MTKKHLKSGTALLMSLALIVPAPIIAQTADAPFPCIAPNGKEVSDSAQLAESILVSGSDGDMGTCAQDVIDAALADGDNVELPAEVVEEVAPVVEEAPVIEEAAEPEVVAEEVLTEEEVGPAEEPVEEVAEEPAVEPMPEVEEPVAEEAPIVEEAPEVVEEVAPEAEEPVVEAETVVEEPAAEAAPEAEAEVAPEAEVAAEPVVEAAPEAEEAVILEAAPEATAEVTPEVTAEEEPEVQAGEAGGEVVSDADRQAMAEENAAEQTESAAAAADAGGETEAEAEVTTQVITEEDVRTSDQDFTTSVSENAALTAETEATEGKRGGLSNFEKALLLGVGAVVVGSVLNNGDKVVSNSGDRVVVERDGELRVLKNDDELLQRPGAQVATQTFQDGSTRTVVAYEDGSQIVTIRASDGSVLRRTLISAQDGQEVILFDDTQAKEAIDFAALPTLESLEAQQRDIDAANTDALTAALQRALFVDVGRSFSLQQVRSYKRVRALAPQVEVEAVTFASGSAAIDPSQAAALGDLGLTMRDIIDNDPSAVFLIEGHTDAVGAASYNLALSDRRAETVALALTEYFDVPPQNLITQGYGETDLKIRVLSDERANRRAVVRNISELLN